MRLQRRKRFPMAENSKIEWCDSTWNCWIGCSRVSPGCEKCYAEAMAKRYGWAEWGKGKPRKRTSANYWKQPLKWNKAPCDQHHIIECEECPKRRVFCASLADWLDEEVPIEWLADLLKLIHDTPNLDWLLLTKRPENWRERIEAARHSLIASVSEKCLGDYLSLPYTHRERVRDWLVKWLEEDEAPSNVWIGTTVEDNLRTTRIADLIEIPAKVHFLSCEPLLESLDLDYWLTEPITPQIDWVICGGESGPKKRPFNCDWARSLRDQCKAAGVKFFFKQVDKVQPIPSDLMIREFPI